MRRALKTLGVNFLEFDESGDSKKSSCEKEYCVLGCICAAISGKPVPPAHCGKETCMFHCFCSEDTVQYSASRKVGISPTGAANLRNTSLRNLSAEEKKFANTVVATSSGRDVVMLGASGRQKRERKMPSRYQDGNDAPGDAAGAADKDSADKDGDAAEADGYSMVDRNAERMRAAALEEETVRSCCVLVPLVRLPEETRVWCLYHCQYECPCKGYKSPLDYAPDRNIKRAMPKCKKEAALRSSGQAKASPKKPAAAGAAGGGPSLAGLPRGPKSAKLRAASELKRRQSADGLSAPAPPPLTHPASQSARTAGYDIKRNVNELKLPHKIVKGAKKLSRHQDKTKAAAEAKKGTSASIMYKTPPVNPSGEIDLSMRQKDEKQFVRWRDFKSAFETDRIVVYVHHRNGRPNIFVARPAEAPYVTNAENVKLIDDLRLMGLPPTIQNLVRPDRNVYDQTDDGITDNEEKYAILNHNGIAWELNGVMQKKVPRSEADQASLMSASKFKSRISLSEIFCIKCKNNLYQYFNN